MPPESATRVGHPAPFPIDLPERLIDLYTYRDDLVLDPFMGSGTTAVAAVRTGRHYVGYDTDAAYVVRAEERVAEERRQVAARVPEELSLFGVEIPAVKAKPAPDAVEEDPEGGFQSRAVKEGRQAKEIAMALLRDCGFTDPRMDVKYPGPGVEVNIVATDTTGADWAFDVSGAFTSNRAGLKRTDTLWKALGKAVGPQPRPNLHLPLVLLTTDAPSKGSAGARALDMASGPDRRRVRRSSRCSTRSIGRAGSAAQPSGATRRSSPTDRCRPTAPSSPSWPPASAWSGATTWPPPSPHRPSVLANVGPDGWDRLGPAVGGGELTGTTSSTASPTAGPSWRRPTPSTGRRPRIVEWTGPRRAPGDEVVPADLRVDHVYLVSCKYLSKVLHNSSPQRLVDGLLTHGPLEERGDWYQAVAPAEHQELYAASVDEPRWRVAGGGVRGARQGAPPPPRHRRSAGRGRPAAVEPYRRCAGPWRGHRRPLGRLASPPRNREAVLWRLLRIGSAPYFVLGTSPGGSMRLRIDTPWDWRQRFSLRRFEVAAQPGGQPRVAWRGHYRVVATGEERTVEGHVELRWSHGRFGGPPEAKVYLDTPHDEVPGYHPLDAEVGSWAARSGRSVWAPPRRSRRTNPS